MDQRPSVIAIGTASVDVFLAGKALAAKRDVRAHDFVEQFPLGTKIDLDHLYFDTGGGASNAAVTFARQGLRSVFAGKVGRDLAGAEVVRVLKRESVDLTHLAYDNNNPTSYSTILLAPNGERTILNYRGASHTLEGRDLDLSILKANWFYITSLAGNLTLLRQIIEHARAQNIKVALNPGGDEIASAKELKRLLAHVDLVMANRDEFQQLFGGSNYRQLLTAATAVTPMAVLTDGPRGAFASDGQMVYYCGEYQKVKVMDRTGAGDAFNSGFVTVLVRGGQIPAALTLASANATAVVQKVGAKAGILASGRLRPAKVKSAKL